MLSGGNTFLIQTVYILYIHHMSMFSPSYICNAYRLAAHSKANPSDRSGHAITVPSGRRVQQYRTESHWRRPRNPLWSAHGGGVHACVSAGGGGEAVCSARGTLRHRSVGGQWGQHQEERGAEPTDSSGRRKK